ncbi:hypothetical protein PHYC_01002 [Phycisphaerales bacterium]|nr:hypothetical protein PHYC_01002 [Phycisphaerales bacterium]
MNIRTVVVAALAGAVAVLSGCIFVAKTERSGRAYSKNSLAIQLETNEQVPGIRERRQDDLARLNPGISVGEFRKAFPDAIYIESRRVNGREWDAYSVTHSELCQYEGTTNTFTYKDELWFFFQDGAYRGFGSPKQWPTDATEPAPQSP